MIRFLFRPRRNPNVWLIALSAVLVFSSLGFIKAKEVSANSFPRATASTESLSDRDRIEVFDKVWKAVNDKYYDPSFNGVDWNAARERYRSRLDGLKSDEEFYTLLNQMLSELHDPHTVFRTPRAIEANRRQQGTSTGVSLREVEGLPAVFRVEPDSEAARAGVEPGMIVRTIDGKPVAERLAVVQKEVGASSSERLTRLRVYARLLAGGAGTSLTLGLERGDNSVLEATLTRRIVSSASKLMSYLLPSGYAYLKFDGFREGIAKEVRATLEKFKDAPAMIIDLRNNGGGEVPEMRKIASYFFNEKVLLGRGVNRTGKPLSYLGGLIRIPLEAYVGEKGGQIYSKPVVILTSDRTGSAAESFTEGLRENDRATVVGSQSCGCVNIVNDTISVKGGGALSISELGYSSPKGRKLEGIGVTPDEVVVLKLSDLRQRRDAWIEKAEGFLKNAIKR